VPEWQGRQYAAPGSNEGKGEGSEVRMSLTRASQMNGHECRDCQCHPSSRTKKRRFAAVHSARLHCVVLVSLRLNGTTAHRDVTYVYKEMNSVGLQYGPKFSMLQDVYMTPEAALH